MLHITPSYIHLRWKKLVGTFWDLRKKWNHPKLERLTSFSLDKNKKFKYNNRDGKLWARERYRGRCFSFCHERRTKKKIWFLMRNRTSDRRIPRSDALPLSHRDLTACEIYYEIHMLRVPHTARVSHVDSVMFVNRLRKMVFYLRSSYDTRPAYH